MNSAIYKGWVRHRRGLPMEHSFRYRVFMLYLDLEELPELFDRHPLWSARRPAPVRWRRSDYMGDPDRPLDESVRDLVEQRTGTRPDGPIHLLTHGRYLGVGFNPISVYYCFDREGGQVTHAVAEVTNTPWGQSHSYVLERGERVGKVIKQEFEKVLHVSPLMDMHHRYDLSLTEPTHKVGDRLIVQIDSTRTADGPDGPAEAHAFDATLSLERSELNNRSLTTTLLTHPPQSYAVLARIYWQSLKLKLRGARYHAHPEEAGARSSGESSPQVESSPQPEVVR